MLARAARGTGALLLRGSVQASGRAPRRASSGLPRNTVVLFVPQQEAWVVERMGRFHRILEPGLNVLIPVLDRIRYVQSLKEIVINVPEQSAVTLDNVTLQIDGVLYLRIMDPYKASYGVEDPEYAVTQLAQTTMRSELGKLSLDKVFRERESLNANIVDAINQAADYWGIRCLRYEIKDIHVPPRVKESMQMQASAVLAKAKAKAEAIRILASALAQHNGDAAASLTVAEQYVNAFSKLAKDSNTVLLPSNPSDVTSMVAQVEAERRKRATVLESEGTRESAINVAEGKKQAQILASEAEKAEQINQAAGPLEEQSVLLTSEPSFQLLAMGVYGALTKAAVPGAQNSNENSRGAQGTDASLEELGRVKLS
ncbi:stomatin-like protein 2 [Cricetulus griseus]|nr:stomatin-like protein 2 [Cricetulus griseus]